MPESMPHSYYPELADLLRAAGWTRVPGGKGGHEKWRHPDLNKTIILNAKALIDTVLKAKPVAAVMLPVAGVTATRTFTGLVPGRYAIKAFHDVIHTFYGSVHLSFDITCKIDDAVLRALLECCFSSFHFLGTLFFRHF